MIMRYTFFEGLDLKKSVKKYRKLIKLAHQQKEVVPPNLPLFGGNRHTQEQFLLKTEGYYTTVVAFQNWFVVRGPNATEYLLLSTVPKSSNEEKLYTIARTFVQYPQTVADVLVPLLDAAMQAELVSKVPSTWSMTVRVVDVRTNAKVMRTTVQFSQVAKIAEELTALLKQEKPLAQLETSVEFARLGVLHMPSNHPQYFVPA